MRFRKKSAKKVKENKGNLFSGLTMNTLFQRIRELLSFTPYNDKAINIAMMVLLGFGTLMIVSTSMGDPMGEGAQVNMFWHVISSLIKQLIFIAIALVVMLIFNKFFI